MRILRRLLRGILRSFVLVRPDEVEMGIMDQSMSINKRKYRLRFGFIEPLKLMVQKNVFNPASEQFASRAAFPNCADCLT